MIIEGQNFEEDVQILPKCAVPTCNNDIFIAWKGKWVCGPCVVKLQNKECEKANEELEAIA